MSNFGVNLIDLKTGENYENLPYETDSYSLIIINTITDLIPDMEYLLRISYRGELTDENNGFYKTYYLNNFGEKVWVAATQFQPFYARKAFPCYDEPEFKAKFTIALTHGTNYTVLSNMRAEPMPDENGNSLKTTRFPQTPPMSTYTLAFIVSNYESILKASSRKLHFIYMMPTSRSLSNRIEFNSNNNNNNIDNDDTDDENGSDDKISGENYIDENIDVYNDLKNANSWQFSMNISIKCLENLNDYFNSYSMIPYPLDKIEHISLPGEYGIGHASWGLLTHNFENLFDPNLKQFTGHINDYHDDFRKLRSLMVMSQKLVHQWFGNLVTPKWWNNNWIIQGFSIFYSYIIANQTFPNWHLNEFLIFDMVDAGYYLWDETDEPLAGTIKNEAEILSTFERPYFYKAANILRMFYHAITPNAFHQGVSTFLKHMEYSAVDEQDFFKYLQMASRNLSIPFFKDDNAVSKSFETWIHRSGFPILTVTRKYDSSSFTIQQESNTQEFQNLWWIPMNFVTAAEPEFKDTKVEFILPKIHSATIDPAIGKLKIMPSDWLLLNNQQTGYYIVNYDNDNWRLLSIALLDNPSILHDHNKVQIFRDLSILSEKEILPIGIVMEMLRYLKRERSLTAWNGATFLIENLNWKLQGRNVAIDFHSYIKELIEPMFKSLDFYSENDIPYNRYVNENLQIQPSYLRRPILCTNLKFSNIDRFRKVYEKLLEIKDLNERDDLLYALSCSFKIELSEYFIESISTANIENFTQIERSTAIYYSYFNNKINRPTILPILSKNFLKYIRLPSDLLKIFHQKSWYYHGSESQRIIRDSNQLLSQMIGLRLIVLLLLIYYTQIICGGNTFFTPRCMGPYRDENSEILNLRLPNDTKPISYNISLSIDDINRKFIGTNFLIIFSENEKFQFEKNKKYLLSVKYEGSIDEKYARGIYISKSSDNIPIITTQFEPTFARRAFPCYDEPQYKARFQITISHSSLYSALSNMPLDGEPVETTIAEQNSDENDINMMNETIITEPLITIVTTKFQQTPLMSTYILAFILHNYHSVSLTVNNVTHSVYYKNALQIDHARYTVNKSVELLSAMENYFQINYPLSKLDHIGVPTTFGHAMENWGLIIYRYDTYLMDPTCSTIKNLRTIVSVTHEMVHQWFGNLVSPKWWSYIWLNEGFATYYSYVIMRKVFPDCVHDHFYYFDSLNIAFGALCKRPLTTDLVEEIDIMSAFDHISYHRGAAIIRMLNDALTEKTFQRGIYNYLDKYKYDSVDENDLFQCLEEVAIKDDRKYFNKIGFLTEYIKTWTNNRGYPEVVIERNYTTNELKIQQYPISMNFEKDWYIPISIVTSVMPHQEAIPLEYQGYQIDFIVPPIRNFTLNLNNIKSTQNLTANDWLIVNNKVSGLYNVYYDVENWKLIANALKKNPNNFDVLNRIQILRDLFTSFNRYEKHLELFFDTLSYLKYETEILPWYEIIESLQALESNFSWCEIYPKFKNFLHDILKPITKVILNEEYRNKSMIDNQGNSTVTFMKLDSLRDILKLSCDVNIEECLIHSYQELKCVLNRNEDFIDCFNDFEYSLCGGIKKLTIEEFQVILERILVIENVGDMFYITELFKCSDNPDHINLFLNSILDLLNNNDVENKRILYQSIYEIGKSSKFNMKITMEFILKNLADLQKNPFVLKKLLERLQFDDITDEFKILRKRILSELEVENNDDNFGSTDSDNIDIMSLLSRRFLTKCGKATDWLNNYRSESDNIVSNTILSL
ncbi:uncharacterized protein LOC129611946 [Condylostylus longicornis]|uniref:uncharacterized protein LOC129611946 n=1 Tax=Condylostylus longicornis TaxID=2530218 RepID=UPI00244DCE0C|nr:uncharacterized protein LOC129611946 [Condylostylus longicornis]